MNQNEAKGIFLKALPGLTEPLKSAVEFTLANWHKLDLDLKFLEDLPHEEWRDVVGYEGLYKVSNFGRVKSFHSKTGRIVRYTFHREVYPIVCLTKDGATLNHGIHVLVGQAFYPNPENLPVVHHRDDDKHNPSVWNLEWVTYSKNAKLAFESGAKKSFGHVKKLTPDQVRYIRKNYKRYDKEFGARALGQKFNVNPNVIVNVVRYKSYKNVV